MKCARCRSLITGSSRFVLGIWLEDGLVIADTIRLADIQPESGQAALHLNGDRECSKEKSGSLEYIAKIVGVTDESLILPVLRKHY